MRILGIDPGSRLTGYGCVDMTDNGPVLVEAGVFRLGESAVPLPARLAELERDLDDAVTRLGPGVIGVEAIFSHTRWPAAAVVMAHARGVVLLRAAGSAAEIVEIPPAEVKKSLTGTGRATKDQVRAAVEQTLSPGAPLSPADVSDALAIALAAQRRATPAPAGLHSRR